MITALKGITYLVVGVITVALAFGLAIGFLIGFVWIMLLLPIAMIKAIGYIMLVVCSFILLFVTFVAGYTSITWIKDFFIKKGWFRG